MRNTCTRTQCVNVNECVCARKRERFIEPVACNPQQCCEAAMTCNGMTTVRVVRLRTIARREKTHYFRFDWQHKLQPGMLSFYMKNTNKLHKHRRENHTKATSLYLWFLRARARTQNHHDRARHLNRVCVLFVCHRHRCKDAKSQEYTDNNTPRNL